MKALLLGLTLALTVTTPLRTFDKKCLDIFQVDSVQDGVVTFISDDGNEFEWEIEENENWHEDEIAIAILYTYGTPTREDDEILGLLKTR